MKLRLFVIFFISLFCFQMEAVTLNEAKALVNSGDYTRAVVAFRSLIQQPKYAKNAEVNKFYGQCLCMTGEYQESIKYLEVGAKGGMKGAWWYLGISKQHLYDFEGAIESLDKYKSSLNKNSTWLPRTDSIIAECELGLRAVNHVQDVVIIDSLMVPAQNFFSYYKLGHESGHIITPAECGDFVYERSDSTAAVFENLAKDYRLMMLKDEEDDTYNMYSSSYFEGNWNTPEKVESIGGEKYKLAYPFLRTDGETLYFACDTTPGLGGFDIYKTHFNAETDSYYTPVRLGMPFNSPYNDYMLAIDETNQVGWWATDRGAKTGFVCIYLFLFDEEAEYLDGENVSRGRIDRIEDTWKEENYADLLQQIMNATDAPVKEVTLSIPIREGVVYTSINDFKSDRARHAYEVYLRVKEDFDLAKEDLKTLRNDYRESSQANRNLLKSQILQKEALVNRLREQLKESAKEYRNLEP